MRASTRFIAALAAAGILLTGCSGGGTSAPEAAPAVMPAPGFDAVSDLSGGAPASGASADRGPIASPYTTGVERQIARTASMTVVVDDVAATAEKIRALAAPLNGWVTNESLVTSPGADAIGPRPSGSWLTLSVPASRLDDAIAQVGDLGTVRDRNATAEDVTDVVVDLDARITSLEASVTRLQELVQRAGSVADIAAVERELSSRQADLEAMKSQRLRLAGAVERSTLTIALITPNQSTSTNPLQTGWSRGWSAFLESVAALIMVVAASLPFAIFVALIATPIVLIVRSRRRARATKSAAALGELRVDRVHEAAGQQHRPDAEGNGQGDPDDRP